MIAQTPVRGGEIHESRSVQLLGAALDLLAPVRRLARRPGAEYPRGPARPVMLVIDGLLRRPDAPRPGRRAALLDMVEKGLDRWVASALCGMDCQHPDHPRALAPAQVSRAWIVSAKPSDR
jgi:hypothetical protein